MFISYTFLFKVDGHVGLLTTETLQGPRCWRPYHLNIEPDNPLWQKKRKTGEFLGICTGSTRKNSVSLLLTLHG